MNKYIIGLIALIVLIVIGILIFSGGNIFAKKRAVTIANEKISLEVADTDKKREVGLSNKKSLNDKSGMLFIFEEKGYPVFWMKGMAFPIDIIFLDDSKIVSIYKNAPAPASESDTPTITYTPTAPANRVVELKAGKADQLKLKTGDTITLPL